MVNRIERGCFVRGVVFVFLTVSTLSLLGCSNSSPLIDEFDSDPPWGEAPLNVEFYWQVSDPDDDELECSLDIEGDGTFDVVIEECSSGTTYAHTYEEPGIYRPTLMVRDEKGNEVRRSVEVYSNRLVFADNVVFPGELAGFSSATVDGDVVRLTFDGGELPDVDESDIIWGISGVGYLRRVLSVSFEGSDVVLQTTQAMLDEAIVEGTFGVRDHVLDLSSVQCVENCPEGVEASIQRTETMSIDVHRSPLEASVSLRIPIRDIKIRDSSGEEVGEFDIDIEASVTIRKFVLDIDVIAGVTFELEVEPEVELSAELQWEVELARFTHERQLGSWILSAIPIGPFVITPTFIPWITLEASLSSSIEIESSVSVSALAGVSYVGGEVGAFIEPNFTPEFSPPTLDASLSGSTKCSIAPGMSFRLLGVAGPYVSPEAYLQASLTYDLDEAEVCLDVKAGAGFQFGVEMDLFSMVQVRGTASATIAEFDLFTDDDMCWDLRPSDAGPDGDADVDVDADADGECTPNCIDRECGNDGCGGICAYCEDYDACINYECVNIDEDGLIGYWNFDGQNPVDTSGNYEMSITEEQEYPAGYKGFCLHNNRSHKAAATASVSVTDAINFQSGDFTVEFWGKIPRERARGIQIGTRNTDGTKGWSFYIGSSCSQTEYSSYFFVDKIGLLSSLNRFNPMEWHHFIVQKTGEVATLYIDGTVEDEQTWIPPTSGNTFYLGTATHNDPCANKYGGRLGYYYSAWIDELRIYNKGIY